MIREAIASFLVHRLFLEESVIAPTKTPIDITRHGMNPNNCKRGGVTVHNTALSGETIRIRIRD